jgi:hypothetical protein
MKTVAKLAKTHFPRWLARGRIRARQRTGRCYELSLKTLQRLGDSGVADGVSLVHGTALLAWSRTGHAWLEHEGEGEVYDAVFDTVMSVADYVAEYGVIIERRYTIREACKLMVAQSHWGPW